MSKHTTKAPTVEATQWWKNGDHPMDECRTITPVPGDGDPYLSEGKVVRYFRRPDVFGNRSCLSCGERAHVHGWIDSGKRGRIVCPGDFVVTIDGEHYPVSADCWRTVFGQAEAEPSTTREEGEGKP